MKIFNATLTIFLGCLLVLLPGCQKIKENVIEEVGLSMLDGTEWKITLFQQGGTDVSTAFSSYMFRFNRDETVNAIRNNNTEATGSWKGNVSSRTIIAKFATGTSHPLPLLNGTWKITQSTLSSLSANTNAGGEERLMRMEKL
jgi:hypothetical protein